MPIVHITRGDGEVVKAFRSNNPGRALADALDDIADQVKATAIALAPTGRTGRLKATGIGKSHVTPRGPSSYRAEVGLTRKPAYGIYVHEGTGIMGRSKRPITAMEGNVMVFGKFGRKVFAKKIMGQRPQPFLRQAVLIVENTYVPARLARLRMELSRHPFTPF